MYIVQLCGAHAVEDKIETTKTETPPQASHPVQGPPPLMIWQRFNTLDTFTCIWQRVEGSES